MKLPIEDSGRFEFDTYQVVRKSKVTDAEMKHWYYVLALEEPELQNWSMSAFLFEQWIEFSIN